MQPSRSAAVVSAVGADPWDAPYFGAPVYFAYAPSRASGAPDKGSPAVAPDADARGRRANTLASTGPALDTVHPPFFGAPVYLTYDPAIPALSRIAAVGGGPLGTGGSKLEDPERAQYRDAEPVRRQADVAAPRGGWWSRLFGRRR